MRIALSLTDLWDAGGNPSTLWRELQTVVAAARDADFDGIALDHRWLGSPAWNLQPVAAAAYLSAHAGSLSVAVRDLRLALLNPLDVAEQLATLDHAWSGRFQATATTEAEPVEFEAFGVDPRERTARCEEALQVIARLWTEEEVTHAGEFWSITGGRPTLRPRQRPGPPMAMTATDESGAALAASNGCGVHVPATVAREEAGRIVSTYRREISSAGSGRFGAEVSIRRVHVMSESRSEDAIGKARAAFERLASSRPHRSSASDVGTDPWVAGDPEQCAEALDSYRQLGFDQVDLWPGSPRDSVDDLLEHVARAGRHLCGV